MTVQKQELYRLVDCLDKKDMKSAIDFLEFLVKRSNKKPSYWKEIDQAEPDDEPLSKEELEQLNSKEGYVSWEYGEPFEK
ncbi:hypothetical protein CN275_00520 [Bacillus anthracis]|nr:hypothetical protein CN275_00520 [Bacillus anthracis]PFR03839.1 hypothetical protein COK10_25120 [Bacillus anthracis]